MCSFEQPNRSRDRESLEKMVEYGRARALQAVSEESRLWWETMANWADNTPPESEAT